MSKILNQLLYSSVVFGSELPNGVLRLESTSSGSKGAVEVVGSNLDLIIDSQIARITHANTNTRIYTLPDLSGTVLVSAIFTDANQLLYSTGSGTYATLDTIASGVLSTLPTGELQWVTGANNQVLTLVGGAVTFQDLPDYGSVESGLANQLAYYAATGNDISGLTTTASRALLSSPTGTLAWSLITAGYLKASGGTQLPDGAATQLLSSEGDGSFAWVNQNPSVINTGNQYRLPYYSVSPSGTTVSASGFIATDEPNRALSLLNLGSVRFYEATGNGTSYIEIKAPLDLTNSKTYILPPTDGSAGALLQTDGSGNLSFITLNNGKVNVGQINQLAYYAANGNEVSGLATTASRILGSTPVGALSWMLIPETYLLGSGTSPLVAAGQPNKLLVSTSSGGFSWANPVDVTGSVSDGLENHLAIYPSDGRVVDDVSFLTIDPATNALNILVDGKLRLYDADSSHYTELKSPSALVANVELVLPEALPAVDGSILTGEADGTLSFKAPFSDTRWFKRGEVTLIADTRFTEITYPEPFDAVPNSTYVQWVMGDNSPYLPTYGVEQSTETGFIVRFSTKIPATGTYKIVWESKA